MWYCSIQAHAIAALLSSLMPHRAQIFSLVILMAESCLSFELSSLPCICSAFVYLSPNLCLTVTVSPELPIIAEHKIKIMSNKSLEL